jgi:calcineurin-like phosphoesterase family protein
MDECLLHNINTHVHQNDHLYYLGDWGFFGKENFATAAKRYRDRINCKNITFIWGNHDNKGRGNTDFTRLFRGCYDMLETKVEDQLIVLTHYSMRVWNKGHRGSWNLFGHSHGSLPDDPNALAIDVGVDAAALLLKHQLHPIAAAASKLEGLNPNDYRPLSFEEIKTVMSKKTWKPVDHHQ